jgi:ribosomal protein S18 acetylase RimI-like enzyme
MPLDQTPATTDHVERAFSFLRRGDARGTNERPFRFGTAIFTPELPHRFDSNLLYVDRPVPSTDELVAKADRLFGEAGLAHRAILFRDDAEGERVAAELPHWDVHRHVIMAQLREPDAPVDTSGVAEVGHEGIRRARRAMIVSYPWGTPAVADQLLDYKPLLARWVTVRGFATLVDGAVVSYADLYVDGTDAQIEDVATLPEHRRRGHAKAIVTRAADEARAAGADFVFLVADENDWPKGLYGRLGFDVVGRYVKLLRRR